MTALTTAVLTLALLVSGPRQAAPDLDPPARPSVVVIIADDQGYGDIRALHPACAVETPNMDRLVAEGADLTEAYSASAFCTPSRYALLTGRYTWRTYAKIGFPQDPLNFAPAPVPDPLPPYPSLERATLPRLLAELGYRNAVVGKWHLVTPPAELGFHYSFLHDGYFVKRWTRRWLPRRPRTASASPTSCSGAVPRRSPRSCSTAATVTSRCAAGAGS